MHEDTLQLASKRFVDVGDFAWRLLYKTQILRDKLKIFQDTYLIINLI